MSGHALRLRAVAMISIAALTATAAHAQEAMPAAAFVTRLQEVAHRQLFRGLGIDPKVIAALSQADFAGAVDSLSAGAAQGSQPFNIALIRLQHGCAFSCA